MAKSLGVYMREYNPAQAFKSSLKNYSDSRDVKSIPLYALGIALPSMLSRVCESPEVFCFLV